jgi:hypothetical protein
VNGLLAAAELGGFFEFELRPNVEDWVPLTTMVTEPSAVALRVHRIRVDLSDRAGIPVDDVEPRVATSLMQLGLAARVVSPAGACLLTSGWIPHLTPERLLWLDQLRNPAPFALSAVVGQPMPDLGAAAAALIDLVVEPVPVSLATSTRSVVRLSDRVLWENVASALAAATVLIARERPETTPQASELLAHLVGRLRLDGLGRLDKQGQFHRRSCCLYYRLPGAGFCEDCVLADPVSDQKVAR